MGADRPPSRPGGSASISSMKAIQRRASGRRAGWVRVLAVLGPGLVVMLADTDAGSIVTAAQSGARWGFRLVPLQLLLIPVLYLVMEPTVRLAIGTGKGHAQLIRERFGTGWAVVSVGTLLISTTGALITEFAGLAGAGRAVGVPAPLAVSLGLVVLLVVAVSGSYRRVEAAGIALGLFEVAFFVAAVRAHPDASALARSLWSPQPLGDGGYLALVMANVGAVIMPWMVFYQQAAMVDKGLGPRDLRAGRLDTAAGAVLTQAVMIAVVVAAGATLYRHHAGSLGSVEQVASALTPYLGGRGGRIAFALGITGAALVASIVTSLAAAWSLAELAGSPRSLNDRPRRAPLFYGAYAVSLGVAATAVLLSHSLVHLTIDVEVMNAALLPIVLGFLLALAWTALPEPLRLRRLERVLLGLLIPAVALLGLAAAWRGI